MEITLEDRRFSGPFKPEKEVLAWADIGQERTDDEPMIAIYPRPDGEPWRLPVEDVLRMIREAASVYRTGERSPD